MCVCLLTGCSARVEVPPPQPDPESLSACGDLAAQLPDEVAGQEARATEPASDLTGAWGDPAIILRCGVAEPDALTPTSQLIVVNGVDWFGQELTAGYRFTTTGRVANVEVSVPDDYAPEAGALTDLAAPISATVPLVSAAP